jgi:glycosyltransferase involved in cell wall biosynthesis
VSLRAADATVAIATAGRPSSLALCLDAVLAGAAQPREIIVVDQSGDDDSSEVVTARGGGPTSIRYLRQATRGLSASRNAALDAAETAVVALTDDDCVPSPGWLAAIVAAFASEAPPQAVTGRVLPLGDERDGYAVASRERDEPAEFRGFTAPWLVGTGANTAVARDWALRVGGYDERLGVGTRGGAGEDLDFIHRLLRAGAVVRYEPEALVYHERQTRTRRRATRMSYGRGVGACCGLWLREGDLHGISTLGSWLGMRGGLLAHAARSRDPERVREELLVLAGTARGLAYGARLRR